MANDAPIGYPSSPSASGHHRVTKLARHKLQIALAAAAAVLAGSGPAAAQDVDRGRELFELCSQCHGERGEGNLLYEAPALAGLSDWYLTAQIEKFKNGARGAHPEDFAGLRMRPMSRALRSEDGQDDVADVVSYLITLPPIKPEPTLDGDAERGKALYAVCTQCHGAAGEGMKPLNGPSLRHVPDWYTVAQLKKFKAGIRGGSPADPNGMLMRGMSLSLTDEQAMKDVAAYILTLSE